ncbi:MAG TPA: aminodeoxychorismate lyase [Candidatus Brocadiaceae bacterium]
MKFPKFVFLNDTIVEDTAGHLSTYDRGFLYGDGLFETVRAYSKKPFRLDDHIERLSNSAKYLEIPFLQTTQKIHNIIEQLLELNNVTDAYIRMTLSRGWGVNGFFPAQKCYPTFVVHVKEISLYPDALYKTGMSLIISPVRRSTSCPISRHKTLSYLTNYLQKKEAIQRGVHDVLILDTDGYIAECSVSNIFIVEKGVVITPSLMANILPGVTRKIVMELCTKNGIHVSEELFGLERVLNADEIFLTNSLMEIMPVSQIDGKPIGRRVPGATTMTLQERYQELI